MNKMCFHPAQLITKADNVSYYGASRKGIMAFRGDIVINFTTIPDAPGINSIPTMLKKHVIRHFGKEIIIPWPDFGLPSVKLSFWSALHGYARTYKSDLDKDISVCFHCAAGHGRTGTALCSMLIALHGFDPAQAVDYVRGNHCMMAVETNEQCQYLREVDEYYNTRYIDDEDMPFGSTSKFNFYRKS